MCEDTDMFPFLVLCCAVLCCALSLSLSLSLSLALSLSPRLDRRDEREKLQELITRRRRGANEFLEHHDAASVGFEEMTARSTATDSTIR